MNDLELVVVKEALADQLIHSFHATSDNGKDKMLTDDEVTPQR